MLSARDPFTPGTRIGRYELVRLLEQDEVASTFAVRIRGPRGSGRTARLEVLDHRVAADLELRTLFLREARAAAKVKHPNFAHVLDAAPHGVGDAHLATVYFDAAPLSELFAAAKDRGITLPVGVVLRIMLDALEPLSEMHAIRLEGGAFRLFHGDLRPEAICVTVEGATRLVPSCAGAAACRISLVTAMDRLAYKAPEQLRYEGSGPAVDGRADQFAIGVLIWEALAGRRPFAAADPVALVRSVLSDAVPSLSDVAPDVPPQVAAVVERLFPRDPRHRFRDVDDLRQMLEVSGRGLIADRAQVALAVRGLVGDRVEQRRDEIRQALAAVGADLSLSVSAADFGTLTDSAPVSEPPPRAQVIEIKRPPPPPAPPRPPVTARSEEERPERPSDPLRAVPVVDVGDEELSAEDIVEVRVRATAQEQEPVSAVPLSSSDFEPLSSGEVADVAAEAPSATPHVEEFEPMSTRGVEQIVDSTPGVAAGSNGTPDRSEHDEQPREEAAAEDHDEGIVPTARAAGIEEPPPKQQPEMAPPASDPITVGGPTKRPKAGKRRAESRAPRSHDDSEHAPQSKQHKKSRPRSEPAPESGSTDSSRTAPTLPPSRPRAPASPPSSEGSGRWTFAIVAGVAALILVGVLLLRGRSQPPPEPPTAQEPTPARSEPTPPQPSVPATMAAPVASTEPTPPLPAAEPKPANEPKAVAESKPAPKTAPEPKPASEPKPAPQPKPTAEPKPVAETKPEPEQKPAEAQPKPQKPKKPAADSRMLDGI